MKRLIISLFALASVLCLQAQPGREQEGGFGGFQLPEIRMEYSKKYSDVDYVGDGKVFHQMDIYMPKEVKASYPVVVHIYGSAWFSNNSKGMADLGTICQALLDAGYAVVTPNHRSSSDAFFPGAIHDIKAVVRYVRAHASEYGFDPSFIATSGFSSGGHLASLAATSADVAELEGTEGNNLQFSSAVDAACDWYGPVNPYTINSPMNMGASSPEEAFLGLPKNKVNEKAFRASAAETYIDADDPPIIIFHGEADNVVPVSQGKEFYEALKRAGVKTEIHIEPQGGHGMNMYSEENLKAMVSFLDDARAAKMRRRPAPAYRTVNPDGSVTFSIRANGAKNVVADICSVKYPMKQDKSGLWKVTTPSLVPGFHYYSLEVDGARFADPVSESFYGCSMMSSAVEIPEPDTELFEIQDVPHGDIRLMNYYSEQTGEWRPLQIYVPAGYDRNKKKYPVVYIHHGGGEDHRGWMQQGRVANIMDNLIAQGKAVPMIVVSVNSNVRIPGAVVTGGYSKQSMQPYRTELIDYIIPFVEKNFRVKTGAHNRAMCGLSMGGGQSFYIGLNEPDVFASVGQFSAGIFGGIAEAKPMDFEKEVPGMISRTGEFNKKHDIYYVSCGEQDPRINATRAAVGRMKDAGVEVVFESYPGDHEWQVWRKSFSSFAQKIFSK